MLMEEDGSDEEDEEEESEEEKSDEEASGFEQAERMLMSKIVVSIKVVFFIY